MSQWGSFCRTLSTLLCCNTVSSEEPPPATLQTLRPTTADSTVISTLTVPPGVPRRSDINDAQALRDIFSSSSSVRGYQAAVTAPHAKPVRLPSFDFDFRMPAPKSPSKPARRLEALGNTIKQSLSEARLSKSSSKASADAENGALRARLPTTSNGVDEHARLLGMSHQSTAMSELLKDRTASQGGYDSDAKSLETALLNSHPATLRLSSGQANQMLHGCEVRNTGEQLYGADVPHLPMSEPLPSGIADQRHTNLKTLPTAVDESRTEPADDLVRQISIGHTDGTINMPDTPELRALCLPNLPGAAEDWRLSLKLPPRESSLKKTSNSRQDILHTSENGVAIHRRDSAAITGGEHGLLSSANPVLREYLSKYVAQLSDTTTSKGWHPPTQVTDHELVLLGDQRADSGQATEYQNTNARPSFSSIQESAKALQNAESDHSSLHLFNMRIFQRLASNSLVPMLSPSRSRVDSLNSEQSQSSTRLSSLSRLPYLVASEHNRRPSDPETRRLFEKETSNRMPTRRHLMASSHNLKLHEKDPLLVPDDTSSVYVSDLERAMSERTSSSHIRRDSASKNPNSLAIGGRSASGGVTASYNSMTQLANAEESAWLKGWNVLAVDGSGDHASAETRTHRSSNSMPSEPAKNVSASTPTPKARKQGNGRSSMAENGSPSEISIGAVCTRRVDAFSADSAGMEQVRKNEGFREPESRPSTLQIPSVEVQTISRTPSVRSGAQRCSEGDVRSSNENDTTELTERTTMQPVVLIRESATDMWDRAMKAAMEGDACPPIESRINRLRPPPSQFDRHGHRRSRTNSSASAETRSVSTADGMQRPHREDTKKPSLGFDPHQHLAAASALAPDNSERLAAEIPVARAPEPAKTVVGSKLVRRSLLDLKRFATVSAPASHLQRKRGATSAAIVHDAWTRFPSHTRDERNGPAGLQDAVLVRDFQALTAAKGSQSDVTAKGRSVMNLLGNKGRTNNSSTPSENVHVRSSWRLFSSRNVKSKSKMIISEVDGVAWPNKTMSLPVRRKGRLVQSMKRLYRSSSSDLKNYTSEYGHRSSMSTGQKLEYPELEVLPGEGLLDLAFLRSMELGRATKLGHKNPGSEKSEDSPGPAEDALSEYETAAEEVEEVETPKNTKLENPETPTSVRKETSFRM